MRARRRQTETNTPGVPRRAVALLSVCCAIGLGSPGVAPPAAAQEVVQPDPRLDVYEGRPVAGVRLVRVVDEDGEQVEGEFDEFDRQRIMNQLRTLEGQPFRAETVLHDESNLDRLGEFRRIQVELVPLEDRSVIVRFKLWPRPRINDVQIEGNRNIRNRRIARIPQVEQLAGTPVDRVRIAQAVAAIKDLYKEKGYYRAEVTVDEDELASHGVLLFKVREGSRTRVTDIRFDFGGRGSFTPGQLRPEIRTKEWIPLIEPAPLDDDVLRQDVDSLTRFYNDRGYLDAKVDFYVRPSPDNREAIVTFYIEEGRIYTLRSVRVFYPERLLPGSFTSLEAAMAGAPRAIVERRIQDQTGFLPEEYPADDEEFVSRVRLLFGLAPEEAPTLADALALAAGRVDSDVGVRVEGPGQVRLYEYGVFGAQQIAGLMSIKVGDVYSEKKVRDSVGSILDAYGELGFVVDQRLDEAVRVVRRRLVDPASPEVDLQIEIAEGQRYRTGEIKIRGNTTTRQEVVMRKLGRLKPDRPMRGPAMTRATARIEERRIFAPRATRITPQRPDPGDPTYRDVLVEVTETNTGEFNLGGSVDSDFGLTGFLTIRQRNFDLTDTPDSAGEFFSNKSFLGAGQTFDLTIAPGTVTQNYSVSLTEPALFESDYSLSGSIFYRSNDFSEYDEQRYGTRFTLGRRFGTQWVGTATLRTESVQLQDINPDEPVDILAVADRNLLNSVGLGLARTTIPITERYRPTRGSRTEVSVEQFGLVFGDFQFTRLGVEHTTFLTVHEDFFGRRTVLSLRGQASWAPQGQDEVPVYERFYLGGRTFRGFDFRSVSPVGFDSSGQLTDTPVGGTWLFFLGAEIEQPIVGDLIAIVGFIDTGTVQESLGFDKYRVSIGTGFRVFVPVLSPAPLAFDFGFPIVKEDTDQTRVFTFSIDIPY